MRCPACGANNGPSAAWCGQCHKRFAPPPPPGPPGGAGDAVAGSADGEDLLAMLPGSTGEIAHGIAHRIGRGFRLMGASWDVVRKDVELLLLPVCAGLLTYFGGRWFFRSYLGWQLAQGPRVENLWALLFAYMAFHLIAFSVNIFFQAASAAGAAQRLRGGDPTARSGLAAAFLRLPQLLLWAIVAAFVNMLARALTRSGPTGQPAGLARRALVRVGDVAWTAVTFLVVPTILHERKNAFSAIKRSAEIFKRHWAEPLVGHLGIGIVIWVLAVPSLLVVSFIGSIDASMGFHSLLVSASLLVSLGACFSGVFQAALYHFATTGEAPRPFRRQDLEETFQG